MTDFLRFIFLFMLIVAVSAFDGQSQELGIPSIDFEPETYRAFMTDTPIEVDGRPDEEIWNRVAWTSSFSDITGDPDRTPRYDTRAKMLWDNHYFYILATLEEPHVWATLTERDAVIFMDNNFEVFIDPDGDTHNYYELEVNALETYWDLMLTQPYRNGGSAIDAWDISGLKIGVDVRGTLNNASDIDSGWTVEMAIPWEVLLEAAPEGKPQDGSVWRVNFSRVEWKTDIVDGQYIKKTDPESGEDLREDNWSWSPQGLVNMHYPEMWGYVEFSEERPGSGSPSFRPDRDETYAWILRNLYYFQNQHLETFGTFTLDREQLFYADLYYDYFPGSDNPAPLSIHVLDETYIMRLNPKDSAYRFYIRSDSKSWRVLKKDI